MFDYRLLISLAGNYSLRTAVKWDCCGQSSFVTGYYVLHILYISFVQKQFCDSFYNVVNNCVIDQNYVQSITNCVSPPAGHLKSLNKSSPKADSQRRAA